MKVNKHTRASRSNGKLIHCPKCDYPTKVHHFNWSAITCYHCKKMIDKNEWKLISSYGIRIEKGKGE